MFMVRTRETHKHTHIQKNKRERERERERERDCRINRISMNEAPTTKLAPCVYRGML